MKPIHDHPCGDVDDPECWEPDDPEGDDEWKPPRRGWWTRLKRRLGIGTPSADWDDAGRILIHELERRWRRRPRP